MFDLLGLIEFPKLFIPYKPLFF